MKLGPHLLLSSLLILPAVLVAQGDGPVVHTLPPALQQKVQFLNPEYLVYAPSGSSNAKLPLLIFLHGAGRVVVADAEYYDWIFAQARD